MSIKKLSKKSNKHSSNTHTRSNASAKAHKAQKKHVIADHKGAFIFIAATAIMGLTVIITFAIIGFSNIKMNEIDTSDDTVQELMSRYFNGTPACFDIGRGLFTDGKMEMSNLNAEQKEKLVIGYLSTSGYGHMTYKSMDALYKELFGKDQTLEKKYRYDTSEGSYISYRSQSSGIILDDDEYYLESDCSYVPEIAICVNLDKAYKSENGNYMKFDVNVLTRDFENSKLFSGLGTDEELVASEEDAANVISTAKKWEALFKYDSKEEIYRLISTKPIK